MRTWLARLPLKARLVVGFAAAMLVVLLAASAFVFWRVQLALDRRIDAELTVQSTDLRSAVSLTSDPAAALGRLGDEGRDAQIIASDGRLTTAGSGGSDRPALLTAAQVQRAAREPTTRSVGSVLSGRGHHFRLRASAVRDAAGQSVVTVAVERLDQRDEALGELLVQLALGNGLALAIASFVGYRLASAALAPVEQYRAEAQRIAHGASGVRLQVPPGRQDELSRLGGTLNEMLDAQESAAWRQRQFIDDASHDLRTPLSILAAEVDVALHEHRSTEELQRALQRIRTDVAGLVTLADDLLALGAQGSRTPQLADTDLRPLLEEVASRTRSQVPAADRLVTIRGAENASATIDPRLVLRALLNLADNALRHGEGEIVLGGDTGVVHGIHVAILSVSDEGPGIEGSFLPHATSRFRRGTESREGEGSGLGLAIAAAIVSDHRGQLRICSGGAHHHEPAHTTSLGAMPCASPRTGTVISLLLPAI